MSPFPNGSIIGLSPPRKLDSNVREKDRASGYTKKKETRKASTCFYPKVGESSFVRSDSRLRRRAGRIGLLKATSGTLDLRGGDSPSHHSRGPLSAGCGLPSVSGLQHAGWLGGGALANLVLNQNVCLWLIVEGC